MRMAGRASSLWCDRHRRRSPTSERRPTAAATAHSASPRAGRVATRRTRASAFCACVEFSKSWQGEGVHVRGVMHIFSSPLVV